MMIHCAAYNARGKRRHTYTSDNIKHAAAWCLEYSERGYEVLMWCNRKPPRRLKAEAKA